MKILPFIKIVKNSLLHKESERYVKEVHESNRSEFEHVLIKNVDNRPDTEKHPKQDDDEAIDHFIDLKKTADLVNEELESKEHPFRFKIYKENNEIFIDLVRLDRNNKVIEIKKKNITHDEFKELIKHIELTEGLFFDGVG